MWSTDDPVTLFGAAMSGRGSEQVSETFRSIQQANAPAVVATEGVHSET
jgi:hypothetical protein